MQEIENSMQETVKRERGSDCQDKKCHAQNPTIKIGT